MVTLSLAKDSFLMIFQVNENIFPCKLSDGNTKLAEEAVQMAVKAWGQRSLTELEAEERLSYACEKVWHVKKPQCLQFNFTSN